MCIFCKCINSFLNIYFRTVPWKEKPMKTVMHPKNHLLRKLVWIKITLCTKMSCMTHLKVQKHLTPIKLLKKMHPAQKSRKRKKNHLRLPLQAHKLLIVPQVNGLVVLFYSILILFKSLMCDNLIWSCIEKQHWTLCILCFYSVVSLVLVIFFPSISSIKSFLNCGPRIYPIWDNGKIVNSH